jgi:hypothetical protein
MAGELLQRQVAAPNAHGSAHRGVSVPSTGRLPEGIGCPGPPPNLEAPGWVTEHVAGANSDSSAAPCIVSPAPPTPRASDKPVSSAPGRVCWNGNVSIGMSPCPTNDLGEPCTP